MKRIFSFVWLVLLTIGVMAQKEAVSKSGAIRIMKEVKPAILEIVPGSVQFLDATGNKAIDATETCKLVFQVTNSGTGEGYGCVAKVSGVGATDGLSFTRMNPLNVIPVNGIETVEIPIKAGMHTVDGRVEFTIQVDEPNGFGTDPMSVDVATFAFVAPHLQVMDYTITGALSSTLEKKKPFDLQVLLQNTQYGLAEDVYVSVSVPDGIMSLGETEYAFSRIEAGQTKSLDYSFIANNSYTGSTIPIQIHIREKHGKYAEDRTIDLSFNQTFASSKIQVDEIVQERKEIQIASLTSAVDKNIPQNPQINTNTYAFIISNESYDTLDPVPCATNDGEVFAKYCRETLGLPAENVRVSKDLTLNRMRQTVSLLLNIAKLTPESHIIFYYAGHGAPDDSSKEAFLIPTDADHVNPNTCYSLNDLYNQFKGLSNNRVTVFLDACFSGKGRADKMLESARGVAIIPKKTTAQGNLVVFSAASGDQTALAHTEEGHGMFTYFLLKKLQETKGEVTYSELKAYLEKEVPLQTLKSHNKMQEPTVNPSAALGDSWKMWTLK